MLYTNYPNERIENRYKLCSCGTTLEVCVKIEYNEYEDCSYVCGIEVGENLRVLAASKRYWEQAYLPCICGIVSVKHIDCGKVHRIYTFKA